MSLPPSDQQPAQDERSFWVSKLGITDLKKNRSPIDVAKYTLMGSLSSRLLTPAPNRPNPAPSSTNDVEVMAAAVRKRQQVAIATIKFLLDLEPIKLDTIWLLLIPLDRERHLLEGIEHACSFPFALGQDLRAFCPDITVSELAAHRGKASLDFIHRYHDLYQPADSGKVFLFPSTWFDQVNGSGGLGPVLSLVVNTDYFFSVTLAQSLSTLRDKPLIRCENCTKSPEEIGPDTRFMVCSRIEFTNSVVNARRQTGKNHKRNCGKHGVSKGLPGTAGDKAWMYQDPDLAFLRDMPRGSSISDFVKSIGIPPEKYPYPSAGAPGLHARERQGCGLLFNDKGEPVRIVLDVLAVKLIFRNIRRFAMSTTEKKGVEALGEYMIKTMAASPGPS
ncbi:hypothetical protein BS17DRAFT_767030 [Gyrodon lividus]|nr:hypothetical protein BS17DRAFT_767030 [Gyrodon lividus]